MPFARQADVVPVLDEPSLTRAMVSIGMNFSHVAHDDEADIEGTLVAASSEGMDRDDLRVLAVLTTWFGVHSLWVNADRLAKLAAGGSARVRAYWSALGRWKSTDRRFAKLTSLHRGAPLDLLAVGDTFQLRRHGEDPRFEGGALRVPANALRDRAADVLAPSEVAKRHRAYRWRLVIGPTFRADAWATLERAPSLSAAELARRVHCSFATAWRVRQDFTAWKAID